MKKQRKRKKVNHKNRNRRGGMLVNMSQARDPTHRFIEIYEH